MMIGYDIQCVPNKKLLHEFKFIWSALRNYKLLKWFYSNFIHLVKITKYTTLIKYTKYTRTA